MMRLLGKILLLLLPFVKSSALNAKADLSKTSSDLPIRLPESLVPSHYFIRLQPFINGNLTFNGYVEITFEAKEPTNKVILHISDIITKNDTITLRAIGKELGSTSLSITKHEFNLERQFYIATVSETLQKGSIYVLVMGYQGYLNDDLKGFYRSSYLDNEGNKVMLATTQFQPTDARKAFPCFDEPAFKAKFTIEMIREEGMSTISNMPRKDTQPFDGQSGWFVDRFNTSFPMSTYLVAFIVSDFAYLELNDTKNEYDYNFRVWARKDSISHLEYAMTLGPKISKFYEDFFNVPFPLPKQDMAAVPDFSAGAMENWGLIIYRESAFLYDEKKAKAQDRMRIASIISHELAHQWFGDLVTPAWWTDLWLNEGFASYMEYLGLVATEPSMNPMEQFIVTDLHKAFKLDSLETSHPISIPVNNPDEINEIFDTISYSKGASILRMMSSFLTEESFRAGLSKYLTDLSYSNADQDDLWRYLTTQAHEDGTLQKDMTVKEVMDTWTLQMGYPVLRVKRREDGTALLQQERFLLSLTGQTTSDSHDYQWWIPITFTTEEMPNFNTSQPCDWMTPMQNLKNITGLPSTEKWVIFNRAQSGFYRVNYDINNWNQIIRQLSDDNKVISSINKAQIIDDAMNLARSGQLRYDIALKTLAYLSQETEFVPIKAALDNLSYLKNMFAYTGGFGSLKKYLASFVIPLYNEIDFTDHLSDPHLKQRKRGLLLHWACSLGHRPCIDAAKELYSKWMKNPENDTIVSPNLKGVVYCTAISEGGEEEWAFAWERYMATDVGTQKKELLQAMACTKSVWILNGFLNRSLSADQGIKKQVVRYIIPAVARTDIGRMVVWEFLKNRWGDIIDYFGSVSFVLNDIMSSVTANLNTKLQLEELKTFKLTYEGRFASARRAVDQAIENTRNNIIWMNNFYPTIENFLHSNNFTSKI